MVDTLFLNLTEDQLREYIGKQVKKTSPKPFKSGLTENTIKGVIMHPVLNIPAFTFNEDASYVECRRCTLINQNN